MKEIQYLLDWLEHFDCDSPQEYFARVEQVRQHIEILGSDIVLWVTKNESGELHGELVASRLTWRIGRISVVMSEVVLDEGVTQEDSAQYPNLRFKIRFNESKENKEEFRFALLNRVREIQDYTRILTADDSFGVTMLQVARAVLAQDNQNVDAASDQVGQWNGTRGCVRDARASLTELRRRGREKVFPVDDLLTVLVEYENEPLVTQQNRREIKERIVLALNSEREAGRTPDSH